MNKDKKDKVSNTVADAVVEIVLTVVFSFIGFVVCLLLKKIFSIKNDNFDLNSYVLVGLIFSLVVVFFVLLIRKFVKKHK